MADLCWERWPLLTEVLIIAILRRCRWPHGTSHLTLDPVHAAQRTALSE
jgi:hypothetical protein